MGSESGVHYPDVSSLDVSVLFRCEGRSCKIFCCHKSGSALTCRLFGPYVSASVISLLISAVDADRDLTVVEYI